MDVHSTVVIAKKYGDSSDKDATNERRSEFGVFAYLYPQLFQDNNKFKNHFIIK